MKLLSMTVLAFVPSIVAIACNPSRAGAKENGAAPEPAGSARVTAVSSAARPGAIDASKLRVEVGRSGVEDSFVHLFGEVHNDTGQPVEDIRIHIELLDPEGKPMNVTGFHRAAQRDVGKEEEEVAHADVSHVAPGGSAPFHYLRDTKKIKGTYGSHRIRVTARPVSGAMPVATVDSPTTAPGDHGLVMLKGTLKVGAAVPCRSPEAYFGFYDANGKLVDVVRPHKNALDEWFQKELAPNQAIAFEGKSFPKGGAAGKVKAWGACRNR